MSDEIEFYYPIPATFFVPKEGAPVLMGDRVIGRVGKVEPIGDGEYSIRVDLDQPLGHEVRGLSISEVIE